MSRLVPELVPRLVQLLPKRSVVIQYIGWYCTRLLVVSVWIGVLWVILGNDLLPRLSSEECHAIINTSNESYWTESIALSYVLPCNSTTSVQCLLTVNINETCSSYLTIFTQSMDDTTNNTRNVGLYQSDRATNSLVDIPEGHFFSLMILVLCSSFGGYIARLVRLPPLLGMMIAGFILRNTSSIMEWISPGWNSVLRNVALTIILIRGGLALDAKKLWKLKIVLPLLAVLPVIFEGGIDGIIGIFYVNLPWQWGLTLG